MTARSQLEIEQLLTSCSYLNLTDRLALGVEHYIAGLPVEEHKSARQKLPYLAQYLPMISYLGVATPDVKYVNQGLYLGGLTEYEKHLTYNKLPGAYRIYSIDILEESLPDLTTLKGRLTQAQMSYPLMLKADKGERGVGIYYLADEEALDNHFAKIENQELYREPSTIQEYCDYTHEYCLQFFQYVDEHGVYRFELGALTLRDMPSVIGDGVSTVESLIAGLDVSGQQRDNIIAGIKRNEATLLDAIPSEGKRVSIVRTASIDFGTKYIEIDLDKEQIRQLSQVVRDSLQNIRPDFLCVGRFDLKANSLDDILAGNIMVIELNASGGMPTHVYDEKYTIAEKYQILKDHFDTYKKIAALNRKFYIPLVSSLLGLPELILALSKSVSKKGITFGKDSKQKARTKEIYEHVFGIIKLGRGLRRTHRIKRTLLLPVISVKKIVSHLSS